ncbi:uncharacterized protein LOC101459802 [Ceratitis capitata]|uniref:Sub2-65 n=1 Tax=Ceratitis capitata TaxID=7213 RepID=B7U9M2_CERCA|nr:uncharacterized protein LOC101459802 [Ceratitis capitata]ACK57534.1 sub2-65 [Ceratitis capitata]
MATQKDASFSSIPVFSSSSEFRVNASHFSGEDLNSFVEILEIIAKLQREQRENEERRNEQIEETRLLLQTSFHISEPSLNSLRCAPSPISSPTKERLSLCIYKNEPGAVSPQLLPPTTPLPKRPISQRSRSSDEDETYFSDVSIRLQRTPCRTPTTLPKKPRLLFPPSPEALKSAKNGSDSEESGIYPLANSSSTSAQKVPKTIRARKRLMSFEKPKRTIRLRILDLLLRRDHLHERKIATNGRNTKIAFSTLDLSVDRAQNEKYSNLALRLLRKMKKEFTTKEVGNENRAELEKLDKALSYMTL